MRPRGAVVVTTMVIAASAGLYPETAKAWVDYLAELIDAILVQVGDMPMIGDDNRMIILLLVVILIAIAMSSKGK